AGRAGQPARDRRRAARGRRQGRLHRRSAGPAVRGHGLLRGGGRRRVGGRARRGGADGRRRPGPDAGAAGGLDRSGRARALSLPGGGGGGPGGAVGGHAPAQGGAVRSLTALLVVAMLWGVALLAFPSRGAPAPRAADPGRAQGIVALTGGSSRRLQAAMTLLQAGRGRRLLISGVNRRTTREEVRRAARAVAGPL